MHHRINPRPLELVLRNEQTKEEKIILLKTDVRFLFTGHHEIKEEIQLSKNLLPGKYELFLFLPDANVRLSKQTGILFTFGEHGYLGK